jgi:hypothetical protein
VLGWDMDDRLVVVFSIYLSVPYLSRPGGRKTTGKMRG